MSPRRNTRYTSSAQNVICPTEASRVISSGRRHPFAIHMSIRITSAVPATIDERKKDTGITGDHHCEASMFGISRYSEPSELWCIVDNVTAAIASMIGSACSSRARKIQARAPKTDCRSERVEDIARHQVDEQRHRRRDVDPVPLPPRRHGLVVAPVLERDRQEFEHAGS